jgi:hypothetical protein
VQPTPTRHFHVKPTLARHFHVKPTLTRHFHVQTTLTRHFPVPPTLSRHFHVPPTLTTHLHVQPTLTRHFHVKCARPQPIFLQHHLIQPQAQNLIKQYGAILHHFLPEVQYYLMPPHSVYVLSQFQGVFVLLVHEFELLLCFEYLSLQAYPTLGEAMN